MNSFWFVSGEWGVASLLRLDLHFCCFPLGICHGFFCAAERNALLLLTVSVVREVIALA
jgi:hypothetical protein